MLKKRILSGIAGLALAIIAGACENPEQTEIVEILFSIPAGTAIGSASELAKIGNDADWPLDGEYYLSKDIDLSGVASWTPIGLDAEHPFRGAFHGNGKTISGLKFPAAFVTQYLGLFGCVEGGFIENFTIDFANDKSTVITLASGAEHNSGILAGYANNSRLRNIRVTAGEGRGFNTSKGGADTASVAVGGVVGKIAATSIVNCSSDVPIVAATNNGSLSAGGVLGAAAAACAVSTLTARGNMETKAVGTGSQVVGGVVGSLASGATALENLFGEMELVSVSAEGGATSNNVTLGGLAGSGRIKNSELRSAAEIRATVPAGSFAGSLSIGGIVGAGGTFVSGCSVTAAAKITALWDLNYNNGYLYAGGVAGSAGVMEYCSVNAPAEITVTRTNTSEATNVGYCYIGGLCGSKSGSTAISDSFSRADVSFDVSLSNDSRIPDIGGIAGYAVGKIIRCYSTGTVNVIDNTNGGKTNTGGIAGYSSTTSSNAISYCAALNTGITVSASSNGASNPVNRIIAAKNGSAPVLTGNVAASTLVPMFNEEGVSFSSDYTGIAGKTLEGVLTEAVFSDAGLGWDFEEVWKWDSGLKLPVLR
jgi:hypothetical protein